MTHRRQPNNTAGPLAEALGCPPASLAELAALEIPRQQQLAAMITARHRQQQDALEAALRRALPACLRPLLGNVVHRET